MSARRFRESASIDARAKLRAAEAARKPARILIPARRETADAEAHVQEARTAFEKGDYLEAGMLLMKARMILNDQKLRLLTR